MKKRFAWTLLLTAVLLLSFSLSGLAAITTKTSTLPEVGSYQLNQSGEWPEMPNSFDDAPENQTVTYHFVTMDETKKNTTEITYNDKNYSVTPHYLAPGMGISSLKSGTYMPANSTWFFDDGKYIDDSGYTQFAYDSKNVSLVGLNTTSTINPLNNKPEPAVTFVRKAADTQNRAHRHILNTSDTFIKNIIFDGNNLNLRAGSFGETLFQVTGTATNLVMEDVIIQNVGAQNYNFFGSNWSNLAIRFEYATEGPHYVNNLTLRNNKTIRGLGILSSNQSLNTHIKDLYIDRNLSADLASVIKIEYSGTDKLADYTKNAVHFYGDLDTFKSANPISEPIWYQSWEFTDNTLENPDSEYRFAYYHKNDGATT